jgi:dTDP-4-dehydrorhamnose reductase
MRIIVTGRHGQLARALAERGRDSGADVVCLGRPEIDLLNSAELARTIEGTPGEIVINAAAYTAVEKAEAEAEFAMRINGLAAQTVAAAAAASGRPVIQISTDYVFDGALDRPYREDDSVDPRSIYGRSKLAGERGAASANPRHVIARTAWLYSPFGANFIKTMLRLGLTRDEVGVVADQQGAPTSAFDLADALIFMARRLVAEPKNPELCGVYHVTGSFYTNWASFAAVIFEEAALLGRKPVTVRPLPTAQYPTAVTRPANSRLDVSKLRNIYGISLPDWRVSTRACVERLILSPEI